MTPDCSVIIPVYNLAAITRQCLDTLLADPPQLFSWEIIVVDDGSRDETQDILAVYRHRIQVLTRQNGGFSRACNEGASRARGRFLVFLNNDTLPKTGWLDALVSYAEEHPQASVVGAKLIYPNGTIQHAGMAIDAKLEPRHLYLGFPSDHPAVSRSRSFPMVTGACMLVPRSTFWGLGGFDTRFVNGYEDVDLCLRLGELGREVHYCAESCLIHLESISEGRTVRDSSNHDLYCERWKPKLKPNDLSYYQQDGLIEVAYGSAHTVHIRVDSQLGILDDEARWESAEQLLASRARQVHQLLKENIHFRVQDVKEAIHGVS